MASKALAFASWLGFPGSHGVSFGLQGICWTLRAPYTLNPKALSPQKP